jgi:hypothetical protein
MGEKKDNKNSNLKIHAFNNIVGKDIPQYRESINRQGNFVQWGDDNLFPYYLISLLSYSPKHNGIVNAKASMIGGNGFDKIKMSNEAKTFIANITNQDDLEEVLKKISLDLEVFGCYALNIIWSNDRKKIAEINYIPVQNIRVLENKDGLDEYLFSKDWRNVNLSENKPKPFKAFSLTNRDEASQILFEKEYTTGSNFYSTPGYVSGLRWIHMEWSISDFHLNNIQNSFQPSIFINFPNGIPTDEEMSLNTRQLNRQFQGPPGKGAPFITYSDDKDSAPVVTTIDSNSSDSQYVELNTVITEGILAAHRVNDPAIFGLNTGLNSGLVSNQSQILNSLEIFKAQYIIPRQIILEKTFNRLARINGIFDKMAISQYELNFAKMDLAISDVMSILESSLADSVKYNMLIINGFSEEDASKLVPNGDIIKPVVKATPEAMEDVNTTPTINDNLKGLSAQENADIYRIIRDFNKGKLPEAMALIRLGAYGIDAETAKEILGL